MSVRRTLGAVVGAALSAALVLTSTSGATAATTSHRGGATYLALKGGATTLALDPGTAQVLADNHVDVAPVSEARVTSAGIAFPIQGGLINAGTLGGRITHSGGLMFSAGGKDLTIRDFTINARRAILTAYVEQLGGRVRILDLDLSKAKLKATAKHLTVSNVKATLSAKAAGALNLYFGTGLFSAGLKIGTAKVSADSAMLHRR